MSTFLDDIIPTESIPAAIDAARSIVIVKDFKIGGSAISSWLSENRSALWLDYEDGSEALPGVKINVIAKAKQMGMKRIDFLLKLWADLAADWQSGTPRFNYLIHDKINQLEDWAELWATAYYKQTIPGKNFKGNSVLELPEGGGYRFLREKFLDLWNAASVAAPRSIWWCSQKLKYIGDGNNKFEVSDLDLVGKCRSIAAGSCDAPALMYREEDGSNWISFVQTSDKRAFCGCRVPRLEGQRFKISWKDADGKLVVDWNQIYPDGK
jgi:hypothetical protein